jgi:drug/metabolite transporter (DMT)-like permease
VTSARLWTLLLLMVVHVTITGGGYVVNKLALAEFEPNAFAFWRFMVGLIGLGIYALFRKTSFKIDRADWPKLILLALVAVPVNQLVYLIGMSKTMPSHAALLYGTTAVFTLLLSAALGMERVRGHKIIAIMVSLAGLAIVVTQGGNFVHSEELLFGDFLIFLAVLAWASYTVLGKPLVQKYGPTQVTFMALVVGSVVSLPFLIPAALLQDYTRVGAVGWFGTLYSGLLLTVVAYNVWFAILDRVDPSQVAILTTPQPVIATSLSAVFVGEEIGWPLVIGGAFVIAGVVVMDAPAFRRRADAIRGMIFK